jgi:hypothetical protein
LAQFKAHPIPVVTPFEPKKTDKPLTIISDFELNSDVRSLQRKKFEMHKTEKAKAAEEARKQQEEERKVYSPPLPLFPPFLFLFTSFHRPFLVLFDC